MDKVIRMVKLGKEVYINRMDVISLITELCLKAESLDSKKDLKCLADTLSDGIEEFNKEGIKL
jgi:hypothetical protein